MAGLEDTHDNAPRPAGGQRTAAAAARPALPPGEPPGIAGAPLARQLACDALYALHTMACLAPCLSSDSVHSADDVSPAPVALRWLCLAAARWRASDSWRRCSRLTCSHTLGHIAFSVVCAQARRFSNARLELLELLSLQPCLQLGFKLGSQLHSGVTHQDCAMTQGGGSTLIVHPPCWHRAQRCVVLLQQCWHPGPELSAGLRPRSLSTPCARPLQGQPSSDKAGKNALRACLCARFTLQLSLERTARLKPELLQQLDRVSAAALAP